MVCFVLDCDSVTEAVTEAVTVTVTVTGSGEGANGGSMDEYYRPEHLPRFGDIADGAPELAQRFFDYYKAVFEDGALSVREKALIALAVAHAVQCPYCIDAYSQESLRQGADLEQMTEAVHVATAIRGGASLIHGIQMVDHALRSSM